MKYRDTLGLFFAADDQDFWDSDLDSAESMLDALSDLERCGAVECPLHGVLTFSSVGGTLAATLTISKSLDNQGVESPSIFQAHPSFKCAIFLSGRSCGMT